MSEEGCNNYYANFDNECSSMNKCRDCANGEDLYNPTICFPTNYS